MNLCGLNKNEQVKTQKDRLEPKWNSANPNEPVQTQMNRYEPKLTIVNPVEHL